MQILKYYTIISNHLEWKNTGLGFKKSAISRDL